MGGASSSTLYAMITSGASAGYVACSYVFNNAADYNTTGNSTNSTKNPNFTSTFATDSSYFNLTMFLSEMNAASEAAALALNNSSLKLNYTMTGTYE